MKIQMKQQSIFLALVITLFTLCIASNGQMRGSSTSPARVSRIAGFPATGRKVAEELNPQPLPPCEKCAAVPTRPHGDPINQGRRRTFRQLR